MSKQNYIYICEVCKKTTVYTPDSFTLDILYNNMMDAEYGF